MLRGSRGGPLTPLAAQLNHDWTHLQAQRIEAQGQRVESMLSQFARQAGDAPGRLGSAAMAAGWPHVSLGNPSAVAALLDCLRNAGMDEQVSVLLRRDPAAHVCLDHLGAAGRLITSWSEAGAQRQAIALAARATPALTSRTARYRCSTTDTSTSANPGLPPLDARKRRVKAKPNQWHL